MSNKLPPKVLVVEPDEVMNTNICNMIERYWFDVAKAKDGETAYKIAKSNVINIAVISSRMQDESAIELAFRLKKIPELKTLPILFLIEQSESKSNYNAVGNDCTETLYRPFTPNELMTSTRSLLRKSRPTFQDRMISYNDISIDLSTFRVNRKGKQIYLGPTEFKILQLFLQKPKNIYSRQEIIEYVWETDKNIEPRTIDVHINRIRNIMKIDSDVYPIIKTIRGQGYCLD